MTHENLKRLYLFIQAKSKKLVKEKKILLTSGWNICSSQKLSVGAFDIVILQENLICLFLYFRLRTNCNENLHWHQIIFNSFCVEWVNFHFTSRYWAFFNEIWLRDFFDYVLMFSFDLLNTEYIQIYSEKFLQLQIQYK